MRGREELTDDVVCEMVEVKIVLVVSERICIIGEFGSTVTGIFRCLLSISSPATRNPKKIKLYDGVRHRIVVYGIVKKRLTSKIVLGIVTQCKVL